MTNEIIVRSIDDGLKVSKILAESGFFKDIKTAAQAMVKVMAGVELGITPLAAVTGIHIVEGKTTLGSGLVASQIQRSGGYRYKILEYSEDKCSLLFQEKEDGKWVDCGPSSDFTTEDAKKAELLGKLNWKRYKKAMLFSRALTQGARLYTPSVFGGPVYTPEELGDDTISKTLDVAHEEVKIETQAATTTPTPSVEVKTPETKQEKPDDKKVRLLPDNSTMNEIQKLSESLALNNEERSKLRERAGTWDKPTAEKNLDDLKKRIDDRKANGVTPGQTEYISNLLAANETLFTPNEITAAIEGVHKCNAFVEAGSKIGEIVTEVNERIKAKNTHNKKAPKTPTIEPVSEATVIEGGNPFTE